MTSAPAAGAARAPLLFGAFAGDDSYRGDTRATDALQEALGRPIDIVSWYQSWGGGDWVSSVQPQLFRAVAGSGRTPLVTWEPWDARAPAGAQAEYRLQRIADGAFDAYIAGWAVRLRSLRHRVYLRPMHEMNGDWYPWAGGVDGNTPRLFIRAWRRMHAIFAAQGAGNVRWVWSANNVDVGSAPLEAFYPGRAHTDVLAFDAYNWGAAMPQFGGWQPFSAIAEDTYDRLRRLGPQPIWITEIGSAPDGGSKAAWVRDMFATAATMDRLRAIVWFNVDKERDWRADASPAVAAAFRPAEPSLRLRVPRLARTNTSMTVRWTGDTIAAVERWRITVNGRSVRTVRAPAARSATISIGRPGRHRLTVTGAGADDDTVVSATSTVHVA